MKEKISKLSMKPQTEQGGNITLTGWQEISVIGMVFFAILMIMLNIYISLTIN